jgi:hypothetical protein
MAVIDWPAAITALDEGGLPVGGGERRVLRLAASLADGILVDLRDAFTRMDTANVDRAVRAMLYASGRRLNARDTRVLSAWLSGHRPKINGNADL